MLRLEIAWWRSSCRLPELVLCIAQKAHPEFSSVERRRIDCVFSRFSLLAVVAAVGSRCRWKSTLFIPQEVVERVSTMPVGGLVPSATDNPAEPA